MTLISVLNFTNPVKRIASMILLERNPDQIDGGVTEVAGYMLLVHGDGRGRSNHRETDARDNRARPGLP
jgi:hypothetical protein